MFLNLISHLETINYIQLRFNDSARMIIYTRHDRNFLAIRYYSVGILRNVAYTQLSLGSLFVSKKAKALWDTANKSNTNKIAVF